MAFSCANFSVDYSMANLSLTFSVGNLSLAFSLAELSMANQPNLRQYGIGRTGDAMRTWPKEKAEIVKRLAWVESVLSTLETEYEAAGWRKSMIISKSVEKAQKQLERAIVRFGAKDIEGCIESANLAWLYATFGRRLMDAETAEGLLGDQSFMELTDDESAESALYIRSFGRMEQQILKLRGKIKENSSSNQAT